MPAEAQTSNGSAVASQTRLWRTAPKAFGVGAGDGNRTHLAGLGSRCITTMLRPHPDAVHYHPEKDSGQALLGPLLEERVTRS